MTRIFTSLIALACFVSCGESENNEHGDHEHASVGEDACEHMADGPSQAVQTAGVGGTPSTLSATHTRYDMSVPADMPVLFDVEIAAASEMHLFFNQDVDIRLSNATGEELTPAEQLPSVDDCSEVVEGVAFDLGVGTYSLEVTAPAADLSVVLVPGEE